jgi:hypothetical protein
MELKSDAEDDEGHIRLRLRKKQGGVIQQCKQENPSILVGDTAA